MITFCPKCRTYWKLTHELPPEEISCPKCQNHFSLKQWYNQNTEIIPGSEDVMMSPVVEKQWQKPFVSATGLAIWTVVILTVMMGLSAYSVWFLDQLLAQPSEAVTHDDRFQYLFGEDMQFLTGSWIFITLCFTGSWCYWITVTYRNLDSLIPGPLLLTPGALLMFHFVPVANLFIPSLAMYEIWKFSHPRLLGVFKQSVNLVSCGMVLLGISLAIQLMILFMAIVMPVDLPYARETMMQRLVNWNFIVFVTAPFLILTIITLTLNQNHRHRKVMQRMKEMDYRL